MITIHAAAQRAIETLAEEMAECLDQMPDDDPERERIAALLGRLEMALMEERT